MSGRIEDAHTTRAINYLEAYSVTDGSLIISRGRDQEYKRRYNSRIEGSSDKQ